MEFNTDTNYNYEIPRALHQSFNSWFHEQQVERQRQTLVNQGHTQFENLSEVCPTVALLNCNIAPTANNLERYLNISSQVNEICQRQLGPSFNQTNSVNQIHQILNWQPALPSFASVAQKFPQLNLSKKNLKDFSEYFRPHLPDLPPSTTLDGNFPPQINTNKAYWENEFKKVIPNFSTDLLTEVDKSTAIDINPDTNPYLVGQQTLRQALINQGVDVSSFNLPKHYFFHKDLTLAQKKFGLLTKDLDSTCETSVSSVPFAQNFENQQSNFARGQHDEKILSCYFRHKLLGKDLGQEYLEKNMLGMGKGPGANLAYFGGCLKHKISVGFERFKHSCQVIGNRLDVCSQDDFSYATNGSYCLSKNEQLPDNLKNSMKVLSLADHQGFRMQLATKNGMSYEEVSQEALSAMYQSGLSDQPELQLGIWDRKLQDRLLNRSKGVAHTGFQLGNGLISFAHSFLLNMHADSLCDILSHDEQIQFGQHIAESVGESVAKRDGKFQKQLKIDPSNPDYLTGCEETAALLDLFGAFTVASAGAKSALKLGEALIPAAKKAPKLINAALKDFHIESGNRVLQFQLNPILETNVAYSGAPVFKVISHNKSVFKANAIAKAEGFAILHTEVGGVSTAEVVLKARAGLDAKGYTGPIMGGNYRKLDKALANKIYCIQHVKDPAVVKQVMSANRVFQRHHIIPRGNARGNELIYNKFLKKIGIKSDDPLNLWHMPHEGPHPIPYHNWLKDKMKLILVEAGDNPTLTRKLYLERIRQAIIENPRMLDAPWWKAQGYDW